MVLSSAKEPDMIAKALLARFESRTGRDDEIERLLAGARPLVEREPATVVWFGLRYGRGDYGIFDAFADEAGRQAHLNGAVAKSLIDAQQTTLDGAPKIQQMDVLACKLPNAGGLTDITSGLVLTFKARQGHEEQVAQFLRDAQHYVDDEPGTRAWFALQLDAGHFGIFDVFPDNGARFTHMTGHVPRELAKHALTLLGGMPDIHLLDVVAVSHQSTAVA
jgi:quinol monooxygenase YgiN